MSKIKSDVAWVLKTISSKELQDDYAKKIEFSIPAVIDELICCWADDLYHPSASFFKDQFTSQEMVIFEEFNQIFNVYADEKSQKSWSKIMEAAKIALNKLQWDQKAYQSSDYFKNDS
ncbi:hypothetical protein KC734_08100 [candidate division KSB1 bacterium]|nr:hypothetical protein [candidate division KSB1 bacterium]